MEGHILVTPEQLINTAEEFNSQGQLIANLTEEMMNSVTSLSSAWEGEASQAYIRKFQQLEDDIQKMSSMIKEHVMDLKQMAEAYQRAETSNLEEINSLTSDVIS